MREQTKQIIESIAPYDKLEANHRADALEWIQSDAPLYRIKKPDIPNKHLVSYFAIFDPEHHKILLQDHILAQLWLPAGGHVDPDEDPAETVRRECLEELGIEASFIRDTPRFITVTQTNGQGRHTDVSLWYALKSNHLVTLSIEPDRFNEVRWWNIEDVLAAPSSQFDPELHRFLGKLSQENVI